jgi:response regulator RpfG family c-di-GMP phosphodiesterase
MLIDDSPDDNFFHSREIKKADIATKIITENSGEEALAYLKSNQEPHSDLIFLDINMPGMNGWEFLEEYNKLDKDLQGHAIVIMLTTSDNSSDVAKSKTFGSVSEYITKPLTKEILKGITDKYFKE